MKRGEVYLVDFGASRGSEPEGFRPALILQNDVGNQFAPNTIVAAISASGTGRTFPVEVRVDPPDGGLERPSKVDCSLLLTVDKRRCLQLLGRLGPGTMNRVDGALLLSLGLPRP